MARQPTLSKSILRPATRADVPDILRLIKELAVYEKAPKGVTLTRAELLADGFGRKPLFKTILAELDGGVVGMALYYFSYSTWKGKCVYLEDIIVTQKHRGSGIGKQLFEEMIRVSHAYGARRLHFQALNWNTSALNFYKKYGCAISNEWVNVRLTREQLNKLARRPKN